MRSTPVHFKKVANAPAILVDDTGHPLNLSLGESSGGNTEGITLVVDEELGTFTLTVPDAQVEE